MADVSVKMGVSGISQFKQGMSEAQASVRTLDAALKANEKQFAKSGDAEAHYAAQTTLLNQKLQQQKQIVENAEKALKQMEANGVKQSSTAYQNMQRALIEANSAMMDTQDQLDSLGSKATETTQKTDDLATSLGGLNKKISLDQVISAIGSITSGMERAAKKAVDFGQQLWDSIMDSARRADDTATMAEMYGIDLDRFQRMQKLVEGGLDTSVEAILGAQDKLKKGIGSGNKQVMEYMEELGLLADAGKEKGSMMLVSDDEVEMFWQAGKAIMAMGDAYDKEAAAQAMFGKSWKELVPLFNTYDSLEEYNKALAEQTVNSEDTIRDLTALNDAVGKLESSWTTLKDEVLGALAPALTKGADSISKLLDSLTTYLQTEQGQQMLENLGNAVEGLFQGLSEINPEDVAKSFSDIFTGIVSGMEWISQNKDTVIAALEGIGIAFAGLKLAELAGNVWKFVDGAKTLMGLGGNGNTPPGGTGDGGTSTITKALPYIGELGAGVVMAGGAMLAPAIITKIISDLIPEEDKLFSEKRVMGADTTSDEIENLIKWVKLRNQMVDLNDQLMTDMDNAELGDRLEQMTEESGKLYNLVKDTDLFKRYKDFVEANGGTLFGFNKLDPKVLEEMLNENPPEVKVEPTVDDGAAESISEQIGTVSVPVRLEYAGGAGVNMPESHANGIWSVPFDGYSAILHKGERVIPAREVAASRNFSSNLYVESMYMNNGQDADGLAAAMAAAQRRTMSGYGS